MDSKPTFSHTQLKNTGIILVVMGLIFLGTGIRTNFLPSPFNYFTITALLIEFTGVGLLIAYYLKTDTKQLKLRLYMATAMLVVVLTYYFAIARV